MLKLKLSPSLNASGKEDEKKVADRERKSVDQLVLLARKLETNNENFICAISLGLTFLQQIQITPPTTPIVEYWKNISQICFPGDGLPKGKIDKGVIERYRVPLKTFVDQNRYRVAPLALTTFNASSTSSITSQSAAADAFEAITADQKEKKCHSNDSAGRFEAKMFWDPKTNRTNKWDVPSEPIFTQNACRFSELSQKSMAETVKVLNTRSWVDLEAKLMSELLQLVPGHTGEDRKNNIRIAASLISMIASQAERHEGLSDTLRLMSEYDPLHVNLYCIIIEFLTIPENWKVIKDRFPILKNDSIYVLLRHFGNSLRDGYISELETTLSVCIDTQENEEMQFRRLHMAVNLVMIARHFAVVVTCHNDIVFEHYKDQLRKHHPKYFFLYPEMANVIQHQWRALTSWILSGLSPSSIEGFMTFVGAIASYTTPSRIASAMRQCQNENCAFCFDYQLLLSTESTSTPMPAATRQ